MTDIKQRQKQIISSIQDAISTYKGTSFQVNDEHINVETNELPYDFVLSFFEEFGWQVFLIPKESIIEEDFSHQLYETLQSIADSYNQTIHIEKNPGEVIFTA